MQSPRNSRVTWIWALLALPFAALDLDAQSQQQLYPNLRGASLMRQIEDDFTPRGPLDYGIARDTLFRNVWRTNRDSLVCQYTGYAIPLPDNVDAASTEASAT